MTHSYRLDEAGLSSLLSALRSQGRTLIGPRVKDGAIVYAEIEGAGDLPRGIGDEQAPGRVRLSQREDAAYFGFAAPANSLKTLFHPPRERLLHLRRSATGVQVEAVPVEARPLAIIGARACDLEGLARLDQVLLQGPHPDVRYRARRADTLIVAAHCTSPAANCFCASMDTGPRARHFDLSLSEVPSRTSSLFVLEVGSEAGARAIAGLALEAAPAALVASATKLVERAASGQQRRVDPGLARRALAANAEHAHWGAIAERCLACTNCTASCPTCFCSSYEDQLSLGGEESERTRRADSCFNTDFSHIHGGAVRASTSSRYRQWLTHKFSTWYDQFGTSGCVGCGRCVSWCPVGIDVTQELTVFTAGYTPGASEPERAPSAEAEVAT